MEVGSHLKKIAFFQIRANIADIALDGKFQHPPLLIALAADIKRHVSSEQIAEPIPINIPACRAGNRLQKGVHSRFKALHIVAVSRCLLP